MKLTSCISLCSAFILPLVHCFGSSQHGYPHQVTLGNTHLVSHNQTLHKRDSYSNIHKHNSSSSSDVTKLLCRLTANGPIKPPATPLQNTKLIIWMCLLIIFITTPNTPLTQTRLSSSATGLMPQITNMVAL